MWKLCGVVSLLSCILPALSTATVLPAAQALYTPEPDSLAHPKESILPVPVPVALPGRVKACVEYGSTLSEARGKLKVTVEIRRDEQIAGTVAFRGKIKEVGDEGSGVYKSSFLGCKNLKDSVRADDVVVFVLTYRRFPQMTLEDSFVLTAAVVPTD